jgi:hypothetical protein
VVVSWPTHQINQDVLLVDIALHRYPSIHFFLLRSLVVDDALISSHFITITTTTSQPKTKQSSSPFDLF